MPLVVALIEIAGAFFITAIAFAYDAKTIVTWHTAFVPAALWFNALTAGPVIAALSLYLARYPFVSARRRVFLPAFSVLSCIANTAVYVLQGIDLRGLENSMTSAVQQAPASLRLSPSSPSFPLRRRSSCSRRFAVTRFPPSGTRRRAAARVRSCIGAASWRRFRLRACVLALVAVFVMRFCFYMVHMTVGLGV